MRTQADAAVALADVIDLDRYPIQELSSPKGQALIDYCHASLAFEGACELPGFFKPEAVARLVQEAVQKQPNAYRTDDAHNIYFEEIPQDPSTDDPSGLVERSAKLTVAWDLIDPVSPLRVAYESDELTAFLGAALRMTSFYRYADPLGAASLMLFGDGDELGWHFDRSPFAVTIMLQPAARGGEYQYFYRLRSAEDENAPGVIDAIRETRPGRIKLSPGPGTLTMFRGQYSLHRVTPIEGGRTRINAVLAYSERPGDHLNALTQELFYGRTA